MATIPVTTPMGEDRAMTPPSRRRAQRAAALLALTLGLAGSLAQPSAWAAGMTLDGPYCETTSYTSTRVTYYCRALAQNGVSPYTYDWSRSKGVSLSSLTSPTVYATCTRGNLYRLDVVARDATGQIRENSPGWQTCQPIFAA
jgi:hypothetical protein